VKKLRTQFYLCILYSFLNKHEGHGLDVFFVGGVYNVPPGSEPG